MFSLIRLISYRTTSHSHVLYYLVATRASYKILLKKWQILTLSLDFTGSSRLLVLYEAERDGTEPVKRSPTGRCNKLTIILIR